MIRLLGLLLPLLGFTVLIGLLIQLSSWPRQEDTTSAGSLQSLRHRSAISSDSRRINENSQSVSIILRSDSRNNEKESIISTSDAQINQNIQSMSVSDNPTWRHIVTNIPIPPIVKAWREARLDWHLLLPSHNSKWERFGDPEKGGHLRALVAKEKQATDYLTRFHESGLASLYGHEHGPLLAYSGCDVFQSPCMIHGLDSCASDSFCEWSASRALCIDAMGNSGSHICHSLVDVTGRTISDSSGQCVNVIKEPTVILTLDGESQAMFYHWWAAWSSIYAHWIGALASKRNVHFLVNEIQDPMFFQYFGLLSNNCWRRVKNQVPAGTCFCDVTTIAAAQSGSQAPESATQILEFLNISDLQPPADRPKVGIISRRRKRFLLNEYELYDAVLSMGYDCELLPLESMTMFEQMYALRTLDVLIGVHGSALDNSVFLHRGSVLVQLLPYKLEHRITFQSSAEVVGVKYMDWQLKDGNKTFLHWDLYEQANKEKLTALGRDEILRLGQVAADMREINMFWINQDIIVPLDEWKALVEAAVKQSNANSRISQTKL